MSGNLPSKAVLVCFKLALGLLMLTTINVALLGSQARKQSFMFTITSAAERIKKNIVKYLVEQSVGQLILLSESEQGLTEIDLAGGRLEMSDCRINAPLLSQFVHNYGLELIDGSIGSIIINLQWSELLNYWTTSSLDVENCDTKHELILDQLTLTFKSPIAACNEDHLWHDALSVNSDEDLAASWAPSAIAADLAMQQDEDEEKMVGIVDHFLSRLAVKVTSLSIRLGEDFEISLKELRLSKYLARDDQLVRELTMTGLMVFARDCDVVRVQQPIVITLPILNSDVHVKIGALIMVLPELEMLSRLYNSMSLLIMPKGKGRRWSLEMESLNVQVMGIEVELKQIIFSDGFSGNLRHFSINMEQRPVLTLTNVNLLKRPSDIDCAKASLTLSQLHRLQFVWDQLMSIVTIPTINDSFELTSGDALGIKARVNIRRVDLSLVDQDLAFQGDSVAIDIDQDLKVMSAVMNVFINQNTFNFRGIAITRSYRTRKSIEGLRHDNPKFPFSNCTRYLDNVEVLDNAECEAEVLQALDSIGNTLQITIASAHANVSSLETLASLYNRLDSSGNNFDLAIHSTVGNVSGTVISKYHFDLHNISIVKFHDIFTFRASKLNLAVNGERLLKTPTQSELAITMQGRDVAMQIKGLVGCLTLDQYELIQADYIRIKNECGLNNSVRRISLFIRVLDSCMYLCSGQEEDPLVVYCGGVDYVSEQALLFLDNLHLMTVRDSATEIVEKPGKLALLMHLKQELDMIFEAGLWKIDLMAMHVHNHRSNMTLTPDAFTKTVAIVAKFAQKITLRALKDKNIKVSHEPKVELLQQIEYDEDALLYSTQAIWADEEEPERYMESKQVTDSPKECAVNPLDGEVTAATPDIAESIREAMEDLHVPQKHFEHDSRIFSVNLGLDIRFDFDAEGNHMIAHLGRIKGELYDSGRAQAVIEECQVSNHVLSSPWKTILKRWPRGPDTSNYSNFNASHAVSIELEKISDEYLMRVNCCPVRAYLDQVTLAHIFALFEGVTGKLAGYQEPLPEDEAQLLQQNDWFFRSVEISPIAVKLDYKPRKCDAFKNQGPVVMDWCELSGAEMVLPATKLQGVRGLGQLFKKQLMTWLPHFQGQQLRHALVEGLMPVRTMVNLSSGLAQLILLPMQEMEERTDARVLLRGLKNGMRRTSVEALRLGASMAVKTQIVLERVDSLIQPGERSSASVLPTKSKYSNDPENLSAGLINATNNLRSTFRTIIAIPLEEKSSNGNDKFLRVLPVAVVHSAKGVAGVVQQTLMGIAAAIDPVGQADRLAKYQ